MDEFVQEFLALLAKHGCELSYAALEDAYYIDGPNGEELSFDDILYPPIPASDWSGTVCDPDLIVGLMYKKVRSEHVPEAT